MAEPKTANKSESGVTEAMKPVFVMWASTYNVPEAIDRFRSGGFREYQILAFVEAYYEEQGNG